VRVHLLDANSFSYDLAAEDVRQVPNFSFTQVVFRLPDNLSVGRCTVTIEAHNQFTNSATFRTVSEPRHLLHLPFHLRAM
jgi:hypothetical protein